jgi:hypothetical protein
MFKMMGVALAMTALVGCGTEPTDTASTSDSFKKPDCSLVLCALPLCAEGYVLETRANQCCPQCVPDKPKDCVCSGGYMDATYCGQFGAPWTYRNNACTWRFNAQGGLTAEECAGVEAKHQGDGSGSDIYNLGLSCEYGSSSGATDCRTKGCPTGQHCDICRTLEGSAYVCLPDGAVC